MRLQSLIGRMPLLWVPSTPSLCCCRLHLQGGMDSALHKAEQSADTCIDGSTPRTLQPKRTARKNVNVGHRPRTQSTISVEERMRLHSESGPQDAILRQDWQKFCKTEVPALVMTQMRAIKDLESELGEELTFGGPRGSLRGRPGALEDHRHRAFYQTISESEDKLQNFAARQLACRILGSKDYSCENCWIPIRDCMCQTLERGPLWSGICLWLYMHPKDFLRKNNTGKLLWQVFGNESARLTVCGVKEQEETMWDNFKQAGREEVWCVFPEKDSSDHLVIDNPSGPTETNESLAGATMTKTMHFVLIDGTWGNSKSMLSRLKERAIREWGKGCSMPCIALSPKSVSIMHDLRPQPSIQKICTAAAAGQLLLELSQRADLAHGGLDVASELVESSLELLQNALTIRRDRDGRSTSRAEASFFHRRNSSF